MHLLLDIETSTLYYNGKDVASFKGVVSDLVGPFQMFFCQGFKSRPLGMYDQSFINGVIDNVRLNVVSAEKVFLRMKWLSMLGKFLICRFLPLGL